MDIVSKEDFLSQKERFMKLIKDGAVFVYPTDTIYGIGCDATNEKAVRRIREAKQRDSKPFSVIVPSKSWIMDNCEVPGDRKGWLDKLPGPYTIILRLKKKSAVSASVFLGAGNLGIRMSDHWFNDIVAELCVPVVSTSANLTGEPYMTSIDNLNERIKEKVDFVVYEGKKEARPSTIVDLSGKDVLIKERN